MQVVENDCTPLFSEKVDCNDAISVIIDQLAIPGGSVVEVFQEREITTIGNLCALSESQIRELDIQAIDFPSVKEALINYFSSSTAAAAVAMAEPVTPSVSSKDTIPGINQTIFIIFSRYFIIHFTL